MRRFLLVLLALVVVLVGGVLAAPYVVPRDTLKGWAGDAVSAATGRKLTIGGDFALRLVPALSLRAEDVRFANAPWGEAPDLATVGRLDVAVRLWPLVRGALVVDRLIVERPVVHLEVDRRGANNWTFGEAVPAAEAPPPEDGSSGLPFDRVALGEARLTEGLVTYADARSGAAERVEGIRLTAALDDLTRPFRIDGGLSYRERPVVLTAAIDRPGAVLEGGDSPARLDLTAPAAKVAFAGVARPGGGSPRLDGRLDASVRPIRELASWLKIPLDGVRPNALREASLRANVAATPESVTLAGLDLGLDAIRGRGELTAGLAGRPRLAGRIAFGALDLNPYLPPADAAPPPAPEAPPPGRPTGGAAGGWPDDPLPVDLAAAPPADADLTLSFASLAVDRAKLGAGRVTLKADAGGSAAAIEGLQAYGGRIDAGASARASDAAPTVGARLNARNVAVFPLLAAFAEFERLEGKGDVTADFTGRGVSVRRIIGSLDGRGRVDLRDGAVRGVDLAGLMRSIGSLGLRRERGARPATDFSQLGASFTVRRGLLDNRDLALRSPLIRVTGAGRVNLPAQTLDYRVEPRLVASLEGQGGRDAAGLTVPIIVRGPWASPSYRLDLGGALSGDLRDPRALGAALRGALADPGRLPKGLRDQLGALGGRGGAEKAVRDLLGGGEGGGSEGVGRLLDRALGGGRDAGRNGAAANPSDGKTDDPVGDLMNRALGGFGR